VLGAGSEALVLLVVFVLALGALPFLLVGGAALLARWSAPVAERSSSGVTFRRFAAALVPIGFALWAAHYTFHFLTGALTVIPVAQSAAKDLLGWAALGEPWWTWVGLQPGSVLPLQLGMVVLGMFGSIAVAYAIADREHPGRRSAAALPWALVVVLIAAASMWVFLQPMEMRGTPLAG
jgi:hypothetical protein